MGEFLCTHFNIEDGRNTHFQHIMICYLFVYFKIFYLSISRERGREGGRKGEKHQCVVASCAPHTGDLPRNPGMCPDWELN